MRKVPTRNLFKKLLLRCDRPGCWRRGVPCWDDQVEGEFSERYELRELTLPTVERGRIVERPKTQRFYRECWAHVREGHKTLER